MKNKIDSQNKLRIYVCTWMNSCYAIGNIIGQIFFGGVFYEKYEFYKPCLLLSLVTLVSSIFAIGYLWKNGLLKIVFYDTEDFNLSNADQQTNKTDKSKDMIDNTHPEGDA